MDAIRRLGVALLTLSLPSVAAAQQTPPDDQHLDILIFEPALGPRSFLTVAAAETMSKGQFQLAVGVSYATKPLSVYIVDKSNNNLTTSAEVIDSMVVGHVGFAYGITRDIQAGILVPIIFSEQGQGLDAATGMPQVGGISVSSIGDARLEVNWRVYQKNRMTLSIIPALTVPSSLIAGSDKNFTGDDLPTFRPRAAWEWVSENAKWNVGVNLGFILRKPRTVYSSDVSQQITYGVAAAYHVTERFDLIAEIFGRKGFSLDVDESPLEIDGALRLGLTPSLALQAGGGAGIVKGVGAPGIRVLGGISWSPDYGDADGDGIPNERDKCPNQPEDRDGFQDEDGCPDPDNDGDGIPDDQDKCPNEPEDRDGFQDEDGCPDLDNDKDGIPDDKDACPDEPEDHLPPRPDDGCPKGRGEGEEAVPAPVPGAPAAIPVLVGPDRDHDGIPDAVDKCPDQPETVNGYQDDDGCPDKGGRVLATLAGIEIHLLRAVDVAAGRIKSSSKPMLDQAALLMRSQAHLIGTWRVIWTPPRKAKGDGAAEAKAVKDYLVTRGLDPARVEAAGGKGKAGVRIVGVTKPDGTSLGEPEIEIVPQ